MTERRAAYRIDSNQPAIVQALRAIGATVTVTAGLGDGFPDLVVGYHGRNYLAEIKVSKRSKLTEDERAWHASWRGTVHVWTTPEEAVEIVRDDLQEMQY